MLKSELDKFNHESDAGLAANPPESKPEAHQLQLSVNSESRELVDITSYQNSDDDDYQQVQFEVELFPKKHDLLDYEFAVGAGLGIGAAAVNTTVVQLRLGSPLWGILPPFVAATTLIYTILDNKNAYWRARHEAGMRRFTNAITVVQLAGAFFFAQGVVLQIWPGDKFSLAARLGVPGFALAAVVPIVFIEKHKAIADYCRVRGRSSNCISHAATVKIFEVISQGIGADAGMSAILNLVAGFQEISSQNVVIISAAVAGANMLVEALPKQKHPLIDGLKKTTDIARTVVKGSALGSAFLILLFSIVAGTNEKHIVPTWVAILVAILLAIFIFPAVGYRIYTHCRQPSEQNALSNDDLEAGRGAQKPLSLAQHPQRFNYAGTNLALTNSAVPTETDALVPKKERTEEVSRLEL